MEMLTIEATGKMGAAHIVSEPMEFGECHFAIYKDANDIPEEYYKRIAKQSQNKITEFYSIF
jgi:hypothetical protein